MNTNFLAKQITAIFNVRRPGLFIVRIIEKPMPKCQRSSRLVDTLQEAAETKGEYYFIQ